MRRALNHDLKFFDANGFGVIVERAEADRSQRVLVVIVARDDDGSCCRILKEHLLEKAQRRHEELTSVQDNRWEPGDRCEDALLGGTKMNGAVMALDLVLRIELELDARMDAAQRVNEQDDPACD